jgi:acyl-coenzyme A thioesterase PaaI-like protein
MSPNWSLMRETLLLRAYALPRIPMITLLSPTVVALDDQHAVVRIPLTWRSKNHLGSMYFGALSVGADCTGGLLAMQEMRRRPEKIALVFKDFHANFLKRADGDVHFTCRQGPEIRELVQRAADTGERVELPMDIVATVPGKYGDEPVAKFVLTLSLKRR